MRTPAPVCLTKLISPSAEVTITIAALFKHPVTRSEVMPWPTTQGLADLMSLGDLGPLKLRPCRLWWCQLWSRFSWILMSIFLAVSTQYRTQRSVWDHHPLRYEGRFSMRLRMLLRTAECITGRCDFCATEPLSRSLAASQMFAAFKTRTRCPSS